MLHSSELVRPSQVVNSHWDTSGGNSEKKIHRTTPLNSEEPTSQNSIAALPLVTYQAGETVIADGSRTARVLILRRRRRDRRGGRRFPRVTEPGAVFRGILRPTRSAQQSRRAHSGNLAVSRRRCSRPSETKSDRRTRYDGVSTPAGQRGRFQNVSNFTVDFVGHLILFRVFTGWAQKSNREMEKKMNKQMTPAEIELVQQSFARPDPISDKAALVRVELCPWPPPPNIPAAIAPAGMTMK